MCTESCADVYERLFREFEAVHPLGLIAAVVRQARHDLLGSPRQAIPELLERTARQRLTDMRPTSPRASAIGDVGPAVAGDRGGVARPVPLTDE